MKSLQESRSYWETRLPQRWYSKKKYGTRAYWDETEQKRYSEFFPYLYSLAEFAKHRGEKVLEIGVGVGTDLLQYGKHGAECYGVDLTASAIRTTRERFRQKRMKAVLKRVNAEKLPFAGNTFDVVYSAGVLHHVPDMKKALHEVYRVLKPGGKAIIWLYGKDWKYYFFVPFYHGILQGDLFRMPFSDMQHKHKEVEGNVPIVRFFRKKDLHRMFAYYTSVQLFNHPGVQSLGNRFKALNRLFCSTMNFFFPYGGWTVKATK